MSDNTIESLLERVRAGSLDVAEASAELRRRQTEPLGFATLDHHRSSRCGFAEVIYAAGKTPQQVVAIAQRLLERAPAALATRCSTEQVAALRDAFPETQTPIEADELSGAVCIGKPERVDVPPIPIVTAGTSDSPVAHEARLTCKALGHPAHLVQDVGVAGLHRLVERLPELRRGRVIICIAGMEGALPSVVGGLVDVPVLAVPTSVGYGVNLGGLSALLGMLTSCASGVVAVNIDNGFGAAYTACLINRDRENETADQPIR